MREGLVIREENLIERRAYKLERGWLLERRAY